MGDNNFIWNRSAPKDLSVNNIADYNVMFGSNNDFEKINNSHSW